MADFLNMRATVCPVADRAPEPVRDFVTQIGGDAVASAQRLARTLDALSGEFAEAVTFVRQGRQLPPGCTSGSRLGGLIEAAAEYETLVDKWDAAVKAFPARDEIDG